MIVAATALAGTTATTGAPADADPSTAAATTGATGIGGGDPAPAHPPAGSTPPAGASEITVVARVPRQAARRTGPGWWQTPTGTREGALATAAAAAAVLPDRLVPARFRSPQSGVSGHRRPETPEQRRALRRRRLRWGLAGGAAVVLLGPLLMFAAGYLFFAVPSPDGAVNNQVALISYADGSQLTRLVPEEGNRIKVPVDEVPEHVRQAVLAAEDRTFYSNPGFDLTGILRAAWNQARGGAGGGSTITQQFVKKALVGDDPTLWRKYKEVVLAVKISQERSKDQILGDYLNTIYFGRGAYGIQSAGQLYFGKDVADLTPSEGALLAGLIASPSRWDPAVNPDRAVARWNFVLDGMASEGWLSAGDRAVASFPDTRQRSAAVGGVPEDSRGHLVTAVRDELSSLGISEQDLNQEGLRIATTIDPVRQDAAVAAAQAALDGQPADLRSAMVAIEPDTGGILAYYGGDNGLGLDYARVERLAGSTFKPFVVLAGLLQDPPIGLGETYDGNALPGLRNASGAECDRCDLKQAMTVSNNVVFNTLAREVGPQAVADAARIAGISAPLDNPTAGIALGNKEVSTVDLASAYATIAAGGVWHRPHLIERVVTAEGEVLYETAPEGEQRFSESVARNVTEAMLDVAQRTGRGLGNQPVAAKTGTVQSRFDGENNDAWMAGFTPGLSTSVWFGTDMNTPIRTAAGTPVSGDGLPGEVWQTFMTDALAQEPIQSFEPFEPIGDAPSTVAPDELGEPDPPDAEPAPEDGAAEDQPPVEELPAEEAPAETPPGETAPMPPGAPAPGATPGTPGTDPRADGAEPPAQPPAFGAPTAPDPPARG